MKVHIVHLTLCNCLIQMATGYSDAAIDAMFAKLRQMVRQIDQNQQVNFYMAWDLIRVLDTIQRIWKRGEYMYCRHRVMQKSTETHIVRHF